LEETDIKNPDYYRANNPAIGCYLKDEDSEEKQVSLWDNNGIN